MGWPKGKPRGPRKPKAVPKAQPDDDMEFDDDLQAYVKPKPKGQRLSQPIGPYTLWIDYNGDGLWQARDFESLEEAINWPERPARFVIMKPVKYEVREVGENIERFRPVAVEDIPQGDGRAVDDVGPPADPSDPDSGKARYV